MSRIGRLGKASIAFAGTGDIIAAPPTRMMKSRRLIMCIEASFILPRLSVVFHVD
jgi:hypothetical protein